MGNSQSYSVIVDTSEQSDIVDVSYKFSFPVSLL
jgi:hypothetical protein